MRRRQFTREEYKEKFEKLCFIYQDGEVIVQAKEPYPQYWFVSNKGYVISIHGRKVKKIKARWNERAKQWEYEYLPKGAKHNKKVIVWKIIAEHFCEDEFKISDDTEVHHIKARKTFNPDESEICNCASNLQVLPKSIHNDLTNKYGKTIEQLDKESEERAKKAGVESVQMTNEELMRMLITGMITNDGTPIVYLSKQADDPKDIECKAYTIKAVVLQE